MEDGWLVYGGWIALCGVNVLLAGGFAGLETGVYLVNRVRVELRAEAGQSRAIQLRRLLRNSDNLLAMLLIGTNIHQYIAAFAVSTMFILAGYGDHAEWYAMAVTTPLLFICAESVPKNVFQRMPERLSYTLAWPARCADLLFKTLGLTYLVRTFTSGLLRLLGRRREEKSLLGHDGLASALAEGHAAGTLTGAQRDMAHRVMKIDHVLLSHVMVPMEQVVSVPEDQGREEFLRFLGQHDHSRVPVLGDDGQVRGVVDIYDVLADTPRRSPRECMAPPMILPETLPVTRALYTIQRARRSLVVVADRTGRHVGIVTVKDLVEEIVGDLEEW